MGSGPETTPSAATTAPGGAEAPRLIVTGRARQARMVRVSLVRGGRVYARGSAKPSHGRYRVVLNLVHVPRGRYTEQISLVGLHRTFPERRSVTIAT